MIHIRLANEADVQYIVTFQIDMAKETEGVELVPEVIKKGVLAVHRDPAKGKYIVAVDNERVVGSLMLTPEWSDWRNCWVMWIQSVYILPEFREIGVFKSMYNYVLEDLAKSDEISGLRLYVDRRNLTAIQVYKKMGMDGNHYQLFEWMKQKSE